MKLSPSAIESISPAKYVIVHKRRGSKGIYRRVDSPALEFDEADACLSSHAATFTDSETIGFSIEPYNGKGFDETY